MSHQINAKSVAICDTEPIAIEGIRALLNQCQEFHLAAAEMSLLGGIEMIRQRNGDLAVADAVRVVGHSLPRQAASKMIARSPDDYS